VDRAAWRYAYRTAAVGISAGSIVGGVVLVILNRIMS
jgi:hypothetical protein